MKVTKTLHNCVCLVGIGSLLSMIPVLGVIVSTTVIQNTVKEGNDFYLEYPLLEKIQDYTVKAGWLSIGCFLGAVLVGEKTAKAVRKAEAEEELRNTFSHRYQNRQVRHRESTQTQRVQQYSFQGNTRQILGDFHESLFYAKPVKPLACDGCKYYDGSTYGGNQLICGIHPYGPGDESDLAKQPTSCEDWEGDQPPETRGATDSTKVR